MLEFGSMKFQPGKSCSESQANSPSRAALQLGDSHLGAKTAPLMSRLKIAGGPSGIPDPSVESKTESLLSAAEALQSTNPTYAFFFVLTAYEELAKSHRILDAAHVCHASHNELLVEESMFLHHETKYRVTMGYLDYWISTWDDIRQIFPFNISRLDTPELQADRNEIRERGYKLRMGCLYVDFDGGWIQKISVQPEKVHRNLQMAKSMLSGFQNSLQNWQFAIS